MKDGRKATKLEYDRAYADIEYVGCIGGILSPITEISTCGDGLFLLCCSIGDELLYQTEEAKKYGCRYENYVIDVVDKVVSTTPSAEKILENGQIFIQHNGKRYNLKWLTETEQIHQLYTVVYGAMARFTMVLVKNM